jgi:hypothetical protein
MKKSAVSPEKMVKRRFHFLLKEIPTGIFFIDLPGKPKNFLKLPNPSFTYALK